MVDTNQAKYRDLIHAIADREPKNGFTHLSQMFVGYNDLDTVIKHDPDVISDAFAPATAWLKASLDFALKKVGNDRLLALGEIMQTCLTVEAQRAVLIDVQDECVKRESNKITMEYNAKLRTAKIARGEL